MASTNAFRQLLLLCSIASGAALAQTSPADFALERVSLAPPGSSWLVLNDLDFKTNLAGALSVTNNYAHHPLTTVSNENTLDLGATLTYRRFQFYVDLPFPLAITGDSRLNLGTSPDTVADPRFGTDIRLSGTPGGPLRLGVSAQLYFPSGDPASYLTDRRYRGQFRFLVAGDHGPYSYAAYAGTQLRRSLNVPSPDVPTGDEFLFGAGVARRFPFVSQWKATVGPELFGESNLNGRTGAEALLSARFEPMVNRPHLRVKAGAGHAISPHYGNAGVRVLVGLEYVSRHR